MLDSLRQEKAHSQQLEIQVQLLTNQTEMLQEQVFQLEHKLSVAKEHAANAEHKLPLECTNESLRTMTFGLMDQIADGTPAHDKKKQGVAPLICYLVQVQKMQVTIQAVLKNIATEQMASKTIFLKNSRP